MVRNLPFNAGDLRDAGWIRGLEDSLEDEMTTHSSGESRGQRSLAGYSPQGHKELDVIEAI